MLEVRSVGKEFAGVVAVDNVDLDVAPGESIGIVGPNGSGKTTLLNLISGFAVPGAGRIRLDGQDITGGPPWRACKLGLVRTFQLPSMPARMSVFEVVVSGGRMPVSASPWASLVRFKRTREELERVTREASELLARVGLEEAGEMPAASLSGGQQKLLNLAAALMAHPRLLLLDEPTAGVSPPLRKVLASILDEVRAAGTAIVTVEHDMAFVADVCETVTVLDKGSVIAECTPSELHLDARVVDAYLGTRKADPMTRTEVS